MQLLRTYVKLAIEIVDTDKHMNQTLGIHDVNLQEKLKGWKTSYQQRHEAASKQVATYVESQGRQVSATPLAAQGMSAMGGKIDDAHRAQHTRGLSAGRGVVGGA